jgi:hypothetical protein
MALSASETIETAENFCWRWLSIPLRSRVLRSVIFVHYPHRGESFANLSFVFEGWTSMEMVCLSESACSLAYLRSGFVVS